MRTGVIVAIGVGLGLLALTIGGSATTSKRADESVHGFPVNYDQFFSAAENGYQLVDAPGSRLEEAKQLWYHARDAFKERRKLLPEDATGAIDKYSKERYKMPQGASFATPWPTGWIDEFGREAAGLPSNFGSTFLTVAQQVAPMIPGVGTAAGAAISFTIAIGQGKSFKDSIIAGARGALPVQYRLAFDLGVGVASGQGVDAAAKQAFLKAIPGGEQYYEQGKSLAEKRL